MILHHHNKLNKLNHFMVQSKIYIKESMANINELLLIRNSLLHSLKHRIRKYYFLLHLLQLVSSNYFLRLNHIQYNIMVDKVYSTIYNFHDIFLISLFNYLDQLHILQVYGWDIFQKQFGHYCLKVRRIIVHYILNKN